MPLYARNSEYSNKEFGYVMKDVLLPMALDYHIRSRTIEVDAVAAKELSNLNNVATKAASIAVSRRFNPHGSGGLFPFQ